MLFVGIGRLSGNPAVGSIGEKLIAWDEAAISGQATYERQRHLILARTSEGRHRAQARGVKFGRKSKLTAHPQQEALGNEE
jgi:hypothetical protein